MTQDLTVGKPLSRIWQFAVPVLFGLLLQQVYSLVDTAIVGHALGVMALGGVGATSSVNFLVIGFSGGLCTGMSIPIAQTFGAGDYRALRRYIGNCVWLSAIASALLLALTLPTCRAMLTAMGTPAEQFEYAFDYIFIIFCGIPVIVLYNMGACVLRSLGDSKSPVWFLALASLINIVLDFAAIYGLKMGVAGAAAATAIGNAVGCAMSVMSLFYHSHFLDIHVKAGWRFDKKTMSALSSISGSAMVEQVFMRVGFFTYAKIVAGLGTVAFATHQICMNIINLSFAFGDGLGVAASSLVGQSLGAKRPDMAIIYGKTGQRMAFCISTALFAFFLVGRHFLIELFTDDAQVIALGGVILIIIACTTHVQTAQVVYSGCLRGAGDTKFVAFSSFISIGIIRPGLSWVLCFPCGLGLVGAWLGLFGDQFLRMLFSMTRFRSGRWTKIEV